MVSINANYASSAALRQLKATSQAMADAQERISTGKKINKASDNPSLWAAAAEIQSSIASNSAISDGLKTATVQAKATATALGEIDTALRSIRSKVAEYAGATTDRQGVLTNEIADLQKTVVDAIGAAKVGSTNWLVDKNADFSVSSGKNSTVTIKVADNLYSTDAVYAANGTLDGALDTLLASETYSLLTFATSDLAADSAKINTALNTAITTVGTATTNMGSAAARLDARNTFLTQMTDILSDRLSDLVDADLEEESAKLAALQVKQQLAITALQIANQSSQNILRLFQ